MRRDLLNSIAAALLLLGPLGTATAEEPDAGTSAHLDTHDVSAQQESDSIDDSVNWEEYLGEEPLYETEVNGYRVRFTDEVTGFAETIEVAEERKTVTDLSEVLSKSVGVQVRTMGGLGSYGAASIRGSTPNQVPVFIDGVLLNIGGFSTVNLGDFSLDVLDSIEVYRGNTPLALGTGGIGGAIVLRTKTFQEPVNEFGGSYGSWDTWRLFTLYGGRIGEVDALAIVSGQHQDGDFKYYNRIGTFNNPDDDEFVRRTNNHHTSYSALLKLSRTIGPWRLLLMDDFFFKSQGLPGIANAHGESTAETENLRNSTNIRLERPFGAKTDLTLDLAYVFKRDRFIDMQGSVGVGNQDNVYRTDGVSGTILLQTEFSLQHSSTWRLGTRYEHYDELRKNDKNKEHQQSPSHRMKVELGCEHDWNPLPPLHIVPTLRGEFHYSYFGGGTVAAYQGDFETTERTDFFYSVSLGIRYELIDGLLLRANGGRYTRTPDLSELFGDHGAMVGNPHLRAEIGYNVDAGVTYILTGKSILDFMRADAAWFASWVEDLISLEQNSQSTARPVNIDAATIQGAEFALRLSLFQLATLSGNYTYFHGTNRSKLYYYRGKPLPLRPKHEIYGRLELAKTITNLGLAGWFDADYAGKSYLGQYNNEDFVAMHFFLGLGGRFELPRTGLTFTLEVKNLLDALVFKNENGDWLPMSDYHGYPLPGRTFLATVHWQRPRTWL